VDDEQKRIIEDALSSVTMQLRSAVEDRSGRNHRHAQPAASVRAANAAADRLKPLAGCCDVGSLKSAVQGMCAEFGKLTRIDILTMAEAEKRRALCFLQLESEAQERQLMASLGACRFGNDVLVIVDLPKAPQSSF
jgi:hypothetical protein